MGGCGGLKGEGGTRVPISKGGGNDGGDGGKVDDGVDGDEDMRSGCNGGDHKYALHRPYF